MTDKKEIEVGKHFLVPEHRKLSDEEKKEVLERYNATEKEMPKISKKDPAIKNLGVVEGDLIEIKRKLLTTGENYFYYRVVV